MPPSRVGKAEPDQVLVLLLLLPFCPALKAFPRSQAGKGKNLKEEDIFIFLKSALGILDRGGRKRDAQTEEPAVRSPYYVAAPPDGRGRACVVHPLVGVGVACARSVRAAASPLVVFPTSSPRRPLFDVSPAPDLGHALPVSDHVPGKHRVVEESRGRPGEFSRPLPPSPPPHTHTPSRSLARRHTFSDDFEILLSRPPHRPSHRPASETKRSPPGMFCARLRPTRRPSSGSPSRRVTSRKFFCRTARRTCRWERSWPCSARKPATLESSSRTRPPPRAPQLPKPAETCQHLPRLPRRIRRPRCPPSPSRPTRSSACLPCRPP